MKEVFTAVCIFPGALLCSTASTAQPVTELPLDRGFYVANETPCAQASNATLLLVHREGVNNAQSACYFLSIKKTGEKTFQAEQRCQLSGVDEPEVSAVTYEILSRTSFTFENADGWSGAASLCEQASLPEPWATNDIQDMID